MGFFCLPLSELRQSPAHLTAEAARTAAEMEAERSEHTAMCLPALRTWNTLKEIENITQVKTKCSQPEVVHALNPTTREAEESRSL